MSEVSAFDASEICEPMMLTLDFLAILRIRLIMRLVSYSFLLDV